MIDLLFIAITMAFLFVNIAFAYGCHELMGAAR